MGKSNIFQSHSKWLNINTLRSTFFPNTWQDKGKNSYKQWQQSDNLTDSQSLSAIPSDAFSPDRYFYSFGEGNYKTLAAFDIEEMRKLATS